MKQRLQQQNWNGRRCGMKKRVRNPLQRRILRELKEDWGKYLVIFLFMVMLVSLVSAFLVTDNSVYHAYEEGFSKYHLEWGHFTLSGEPEESFLTELARKGGVKLYDLRYFEEQNKGKDTATTIRVYQVRQNVNLECVMSGSLPVEPDEIAIDRMYAQNAGYQVGDTITLKGKNLRISGLIAVPDYSCLFENNTDMMFDSVNFSIAVMTEQGYQAVGSSKQFYNYAWLYEKNPEDDIAEKAASDDFLETLKEVLTAYDENLVMEQGYENVELLTLTDYLPRYNNKAVNFTGEDMGGDKAMFLLLDYIVIVILAFVFAVTISNTIAKEAGVIGTLRASGYTRKEIIRHYMILPMVVTVVAAIAGNIIGYTWLKKYMVDMYYNSYSLCTYQTLWNMEAFVDTTVIPLILMFVINLAVLSYHMKLSPLDFIRRDLKRKKRKKAFRLNTKIPFLHRFRIRILFQNVPNYITLFLGIQFAAVIVIFGQMLVPLLDDYAKRVESSMIADYQYVLKTPVETENTQAEKYCISELETTDERYMIDEVSIYGIEADSSYINKEIPTGKVLVSNGLMDKFDLNVGDTLTLKSHYDAKTYDFVIAGEYTYDAALSVFMPREEYLELFEKAEDYFTGYFSNELLSDIDEDAVATIVTQEDMTKISRQLKVSMGDFIKLFGAFGVVMFILLMYLLAKQIIEKNAQSISMAKILGFTNGEIGGLYIVATSIVVVISLLVAVPVTDAILRWAFKSYLYTEMTGYFPYTVSNQCFIIMIVLGLLCYGVVSVLQLVKIRNIPKSDALKNVE
jgi:putative ABC transport system permease protein